MAIKVIMMLNMIPRILDVFIPSFNLLLNISSNCSTFFNWLIFPSLQSHMPGESISEHISNWDLNKARKGKENKYWKSTKWVTKLASNVVSHNKELVWTIWGVEVQYSYTSISESFQKDYHRSHIFVSPIKPTDSFSEYFICKKYIAL